MQATYLLAQWYEQGWGVPYDMRKAPACYEQAANEGLHEAEAALLPWYLKRKKDEEDRKKVFYWCEKLAQSGDPEGKLQLTIFYMQGIGVAKNPTRALTAFREAIAAENGGDKHLHDLLSTVMMAATSNTETKPADHPDNAQPQPVSPPEQKAEEEKAQRSSVRSRKALRQVPQILRGRCQAWPS